MLDRLSQEMGRAVEQDLAPAIILLGDDLDRGILGEGDGEIDQLVVHQGSNRIVI